MIQIGVTDTKLVKGYVEIETFDANDDDFLATLNAWNSTCSPTTLQMKNGRQIAERYKFYQRRKGNTENVVDYVAALRKCAEHCNFGDFRQQALRDRLVCVDLQQCNTEETIS